MAHAGSLDLTCFGNQNSPRQKLRLQNTLDQSLDEDDPEMRRVTSKATGAREEAVVRSATKSSLGHERFSRFSSWTSLQRAVGFTDPQGTKVQGHQGLDHGTFTRRKTKRAVSNNRLASSTSRNHHPVDGPDPLFQRGDTSTRECSDQPHRNYQHEESTLQVQVKPLP